MFRQELVAAEVRSTGANKRIGSASLLLSVGIILMERFTLNAFAGFVDALRLAADVGGRSRQIHCRWTVMGRHSVAASCGVNVAPNDGLLDSRDFDYIVICGGNGFENETLNPVESQYIRSAAEAGICLVGICTGSFTLAGLGLMEGRCACVHWNHHDQFIQRFPSIQVSSDQLFIDNGDRITCAGSTGAIDLALYLIARHCGSSMALRSARHLMLSGLRPPSFPQASFLGNIPNIGNLKVRRALHFMQQNLDDPPSVNAIARHVDLSARQLERLFRSALKIAPKAYFRRMRLEYGRWLLLNTDRLVTEIAADCGFSDNAHFSREFRAAFATPPSLLRREVGRRPCETAIHS
jgi:transcriptional regulator GlxA family with amidase domain